MSSDAAQRAVLAGREERARKLGLGILDDEADGDFSLSIERRGDVWTVSLCDPATFEPVQSGEGPTFWSALTDCLRNVVASADGDGSKPPRLAIVAGTEHES